MLTDTCYIYGNTIRSKDILIKNGLVYTENGFENLDIMISGGIITNVGPEIRAEKFKGKVIDAKGKLITPGLIDFHTHIYKNVSIFGIDADTTCIPSGVTTAVDAGTSGWINYLGFKEWIVPKSIINAYAFLNFSSIGIPWRRGEIVNPEYLQIDECIRTISSNRDKILGVKVRLVQNENVELDLLKILKDALFVARETNTSLMVHIKGCDISLDEILPLLNEGDIITHCFHGDRTCSILDEKGRTRQSVIEAQERGVLFDVGHGFGSFSFRVCKAALDQGFLPDILSTDIHALSRDFPVKDLLTTITKFVCLGMDFHDALTRCLGRPLSIIGKLNKNIGKISEGFSADIAIIESKKGVYELYDCENRKLITENIYKCNCTIHNGVVVWESW